MSEILDPIDEMSPSPEEENSRLEQLMINMLEEREKLMDRLRDTQDAFEESTLRLAEVETDNTILMRHLQALLPKDEDQGKLQRLLEELKASGGAINGHMDEIQQSPIAAEIASLVREMTIAKKTIAEQSEEVMELKAERSNMKLLLEHLECLVSRHEKSLRNMVIKQKQNPNTGVSSEVEVLKALKSLFDHHKALDEKVRERLRSANEKNVVLEEQLMLANQEIKSLQDEKRRMKRMLARPNSFRMSAMYDANSFTQEQLKMLQEKDQAIEEIQFSLDECTAQLEEALHHRDELSQRSQELEDDLEGALRDIQALRKDAAKMAQSSATRSLQESVTHLQSQLNTSKEESSRLRDDNQQLKQQLSTLEAKIMKQEDELQSTMSLLKKKDTALSQASSHTEEQLRRRSEELSKAEERRGSFETRILELEARIDTTTRNLHLSREKEVVNGEHIERLQSTVERMLKESNQRLKTHFAEKRALMEEKNALNARLESLSQDLQESKKNNTSLKDQVEQLQRDLHQAKKRLTEIQRSSFIPSSASFHRLTAPPAAPPAIPVTDLDAAIAARTKKTKEPEKDSTTSGSDEGGSLDFMAPGAVSQLMSLLESQVSTLDEHLETMGEESRPQPLNKTTITSSTANTLTTTEEPVALPPPSPPPPSAGSQRSPLRRYKPESFSSSKVHRVAPQVPLSENPISPTTSSTSSPKSKSMRHKNSFSSSIKGVFRRRLGSTGKKGDSEKRNSAPPGTIESIDGTVGGGHLAAKTMPRPGSLDLSDIMEPPMEDEETRKRRSDLVSDMVEKKVPFSEWEHYTVRAWLEVWVGIPFWYTSALRENVQNGATLESVTEIELGQELGITNHLHRLKLRLALQEIISLTTSGSSYLSRTTSLYGEMGHDWISDYWLPSLGLAQYSEIFRVCLVDARMLEHLTKKDLRTLLKMLDNSHRNSLQYGITVLRRLDYNKEELERRRKTVVSNRDVMVWTTDHVVAWAESVGLEEFAQSLHGSGVHGGVIALDDSFDAEALAMAMKIPQHLHDVRRTVKLEFSALLADGTSRVNSESQSHGKIVRRISKRLRVGRRPPVNEYTHMRSQSPVLFPFRGSSAGRLSPLHDSQRTSPLSRNSPTSSSSSISYTTGSQDLDSLKEMTV